jgi:pimeloyl-ACP methyl ester carboxylesterase
MTHRWRVGRVASDGESIYYEVTGAEDAPAIVLTHGAGGSHAAWFQQVPVLADAGYRVVTWDSRGFGLSTFDSGRLGPDEAVADMTAVFDAVGIRRAHLVGQSMGGWWVTAFALAAPERTMSLTLSNTVGGLWTDALGEHFRRFVASAGAGADDDRLGVHSALSPTFVDRDPARAFLYQELNTFHAPPLAAIAGALTRPGIVHAQLDALGLPILAITSADDTLFPPMLVIDSMSRLTNATIVEIADAGHSTYFERPDEYNAELLRFVADR